MKSYLKQIYPIKLILLFFCIFKGEQHNYYADIFITYTKKGTSLSITPYGKYFHKLCGNYYILLPAGFPIKKKEKLQIYILFRDRIFIIFQRAPNIASDNIKKRIAKES